MTREEFLEHLRTLPYEAQIITEEVRGGIRAHAIRFLIGDVQHCFVTAVCLNLGLGEFNVGDFRGMAHVLDMPQENIGVIAYTADGRWYMEEYDEQLRAVFLEIFNLEEPDDGGRGEGNPAGERRGCKEFGLRIGVVPNVITG